MPLDREALRQTSKRLRSRVRQHQPIRVHVGLGATRRWLRQKRVRGGLEARVAVARSQQSIHSATSDESAVRHGCCARFPIQEAVDYSVDCEVPALVAHIATDNAVKVCSRPFFKDEISPDDSVQD